MSSRSAPYRTHKDTQTTSDSQTTKTWAEDIDDLFSERRPILSSETHQLGVGDGSGSSSLHAGRRGRKESCKRLQSNSSPLAMNSGQDSAVLDAIDKGNKVVFLDVALGGGGADDPAEDGQAEEGKPLGRIKLELFVNDCPKTCENFRQFCTGEHPDPVTKRPLGYKNSSFHRVIKDFMIQGGDFINSDGTGKTCIYGSSTFPDENLTTHKHNAPGQLCMANSGPNSNGCQFYITCKAAEWLDGKHCVFGRVLDAESLMTVRKCELVPTKGGANQPRYPLRVVECGEL